VAAALDYLERHAAYARRGKGGREQVQAAGFVAAAFRHRTSRADDPLLHTHVRRELSDQGPPVRAGAGRTLRCEDARRGHDPPRRGCPRHTSAGLRRGSLRVYGRGGRACRRCGTPVAVGMVAIAATIGFCMRIPTVNCPP
jgi:hypothetical protein